MTEETPEKKSKPKVIGWNLVAMAAVIVVAIVLTMIGLQVYTRHGHEITVPNVKGLTEESAKAALAKAGLMGIVDDSVYIKTLPPNCIYNQSISEGSKVKEGRILHLTINTAQPPKITLPDIADNCSSREAQMKLTILGLKLGPLEFIQGERDWVYSIKVNGHEVAAGQKIPSDAVVTLVVGDGSYDMESVESVGSTSNSDSLGLTDESDGQNFMPTE